MTKEKRKITLGLTVSWVFGVIFTLLGIIILFQGAYLYGIVVILGSLLLIPYFQKLLSDKFHFELSIGIKWAIAIIVIVIFLSGVVSMANSIVKEIVPDDIMMTNSANKETANSQVEEKIVTSENTNKIITQGIQYNILREDFLLCSDEDEEIRQQLIAQIYAYDKEAETWNYEEYDEKNEIGVKKLIDIASIRKEKVDACLKILSEMKFLIEDNFNYFEKEGYNPEFKRDDIKESIADYWEISSDIESTIMEWKLLI
jgi:hypothetical protein